MLLINASPVNSQQVTINCVNLLEGAYTGLITAMTQDPEGYMWSITGATGFNNRPPQILLETSVLPAKHTNITDLGE